MWHVVMSVCYAKSLLFIVNVSFLFSLCTVDVLNMDISFFGI